MANITAIVSPKKDARRASCSSFSINASAALANSLFSYRPEANLQPHSKLEKAYHQADSYIQDTIDIRAAA